MFGDTGDELEELLERKARFCLATGIQPSEYDAMTEHELEVFTAEFNRILEERRHG